jgi:uncharacterized phage-associated protein
MKSSAMNKYEWNKIVEVVLYILNKTGGIDYYHLFKILYFAERKHLRKWGDGITSDEYVALSYGPVPSHLYDAIKKNDWRETGFSKSLYNAMEFAGEDASNILIAKRNADMDWLSKSDIECLDSSIKENISLTFNQLKTKSHDIAWRSVSQSNVIDKAMMAKADGATNDVVSYITEQELISKALA